MIEVSEKTVNESLVAAMSAHGTVSPVDKNVMNVYTITLPFPPPMLSTTVIRSTIK